MGILDQLAGQVLGSIGAQKQDPVAQGDLMGSVMGMIDAAGGVPAILAKLQQSGLGDQVASWIGTGDNQAVSGNQLKDALGADSIGNLAQQAGVDPEHASAGLAQILPQIIDKLTPGGQLPDNDMLAQGLNLLKGKMFG